MRLNSLFPSRGGVIGETARGSGELSDPAVFGALAFDGMGWSFSLENQAFNHPSLPVLVTDTACVALVDGGSFSSGPDCMALEHPGDVLIGARRALLEDGTYVVAGLFGVASSNDGLAWTQTLGESPFPAEP